MKPRRISITDAVDAAIATLAPRGLEAHQRTTIIERATRCFNARCKGAGVDMLPNESTIAIANAIAARALIDIREGALERVVRETRIAAGAFR